MTTYDTTPAVPVAVHDQARAEHRELLVHLDELARALNAEGRSASAALVRRAIAALR